MTKSSLQGGAAALAACPCCGSAMRQIDAAPCFDCGHSPREVQECLQAEHDYHVYRVWGHEIVLCDFCDADFASYHPEYWGLAGRPGADYPLEQVQKISSPTPEKDGFCERCGHRLAFLLFRAEVLAQHCADSGVRGRS